MKTITNYFNVKDKTLFLDITNQLEVEVLTEGDRFALSFDNERERFMDSDNEILKEEYVKLHNLLTNGEILIYFERVSIMHCCYIHSNKHTDQRARLIAGTNVSSLKEDLKLFSATGIQRKYVNKLKFPDIANF